MFKFNKIFNLFRNNYVIGKGILQAVNPSLLKTNNYIYTEKIKWELNKDLIYYPYGTLKDIRFTTIKKDIIPFQIIENIKNNKLIYSNNNNSKIEIFHFGMSKIEEDDTITYQVKNNSKAYYLIINKDNQEKHIYIYIL